MATKKADDNNDPISSIFSFTDFSKLLEQYKLPGVDLQGMLEAQRKDMEALAEANRQALEGYKALIEKRNAQLGESLQQWQETLKSGVNAEGLTRQSELFQNGVKQALANFRELAELEASTRNKTWSVVQQRFQENVAELQKLLQPKK